MISLSIRAAEAQPHSNQRMSAEPHSLQTGETGMSIIEFVPCRDIQVKLNNRKQYVIIIALIKQYVIIQCCTKQSFRCHENMHKLRVFMMHFFGISILYCSLLFFVTVILPIIES